MMIVVVVVGIMVVLRVLGRHEFSPSNASSKSIERKINVSHLRDALVGHLLVHIPLLTTSQIN